MRNSAQMPLKGTLLADVLIHAPTQGFVTLPELADRIGRNKASLPTIIFRACKQELLERQNPKHFTPQGYRLSGRGAMLKYALIMRP